MTFGDNLKRIRMKKGMTQQQVADVIGVTYQNISQYERGMRTPKTETLFRLANALNVDLWELVTWDYDAEHGHYLGNEWSEWQKSREKGLRDNTEYNSDEKELINIFRCLNDDGQRILMGTARGLNENPAMKKAGVSNTKTIT